MVIGRTPALEAIDALVAGAADRRGAVLALVGEAGIGKSRLAREARRRGQDAGVAVGCGRASPTTRTPFRPFAEALLAVTRDTGIPGGTQLGPYRPALARVVPEWASDPSPAEPSAVVFAEAIVRTLAAVAADRGLLVVLEDLHWADPETLDAVEYLADNVADAQAAVLLTARPDPATLAVLTRLRDRGSTNSVELQPLQNADAGDLVRACLTSEAGVAEDVVSAVVSAGGGLPLLLEELAAHTATGSRDLPPRFRDSVGERLAALEVSERAVVQAAATLGHVVDPIATGRVCQRAADEVASALGRCVAAHLLVREERGLVFRHALTRESVLALMDPARRRALASRAADDLDATGGDAAALGRLREQAGQPDLAAHALAVAGRGAVERDALGTAVDLLSRAIALDPASANADDARRALVSAHVRGGDAVAALEVGTDLLIRLETGGDPEASCDLRLALARAAVDVGRTEDANRHLTQARLGADAGQRARAAELEARLAMATIAPERLVAAEHLAQAAAAAAESAGEAGVLCDALEVLGRARRVRDLSAAREAFSRALATAQTHGLEVPRIRALTELGTVDMFAEVSPARLLAARTAADRVGALSAVGGIDVNLAAVLVMGGNLPAALVHAQSAEHLGRRYRLRPVAAAGLLFQAVVATHDARYPDVPRLVGEAEALADDDPDILVGTWAMCRAMLSLLRERRDRARKEFAHAGSLLDLKPVLAVDPLRGPWLLVRAVDGDCTSADLDWFRRTSARGARWSDLWGGLAAAVLAGRAGDSNAAGRYAADAALSGRPMPLFTALGMRLAAEAAVADGWGDPVTWLTRSAAEFDRRGHKKALAACRELLRRAGVRVPRARLIDRDVPASLRHHGITAREAEVLSLLGDRLGNREIAARLFLSVRTVEKHVAALMRKTGLDTRADLALCATNPSYLC